MQYFLVVLNVVDFMCSSGSFQNSYKKSCCLIFYKIIDQIPSVLNGTVTLSSSKQVKLFCLF